MVFYFSAHCVLKAAFQEKKSCFIPEFRHKLTDVFFVFRIECFINIEIRSFSVHYPSFFFIHLQSPLHLYAQHFFPIFLQKPLQILRVLDWRISLYFSSFTLSTPLSFHWFPSLWNWHSFPNRRNSFLMQIISFCSWQVQL